MRSTLLHTTLLLLALPVAAASLRAQENSFAIPITVHNNGTGVDGAQDTVTIGLHPDATYGIDAALGEEEQPPAPPSGVFDVRSVGLSGHPTQTPEGMGEGLSLDLRDYASSSQRDTFRLRFQAGDGGYPVTFSWPADLNRFAGSMTIKPQGGEALDMLTTSSLVVTDDAATLVTIIREGDAPAAVRDPQAPGTLLLTASPNPVERSLATSITYRLDRPGNVVLRIYTAAGHTVRTLVDGRQSAATYTERIETGDLSAGRYYCTLVVDGRSVSTVLTVVE